MTCQLLSSYLNLTFAHNLVHNLIVILVEHALIITLLVAQDPQVLGALQLNLKLLSDDTGKGELKCLTLNMSKWRNIPGDVLVTDLIPLRL